MNLLSIWVVLKRIIRDPNLLIIGAAIVVAVSSVTSVDTFTDRVRRGMNRQANALLAADLVITSSQTLPADYRLAADALGLSAATTTAMRSVVSHDDALQLVELKAVSAGYPLRGELITIDNGKQTVSEGIPEPGTIWVEQRLLTMLSVELNTNINIGARSLKVKRIVQVEPDRAGSLFNMAPRVLMNERDLASTKLILPGSRVTNALLLAGSEESVSDFVENLTLRDSDRLRTPDEARPEVSSAIDRAGHFLNLAVLTAIILSTVAIALAARAYASKNAKPCALLRVLGASRRQVFIYFAKELGILTLVCLLIGVSLGLLAQHSVGLLITGWVQGDLPPAKLLGSARAVFVGLIASLGFALPYLLQLPNIAPASILRASTNGSKPNGRLLILFALIATLLITPWDPQAWRLSAWVALGIVMAMILLAFFGQALLGLMYRARHRLGLASRFGANNLWRRKVLTQLQIAGLALGLSALFTLTLVRDQLLDSWLQQLPESAPNQFLINIQPDEKQALAAFFRAHNLAAPKFYPMTRARLVSINDKPMQLEDYQSPRAKRLANREFNLSYSEKLKPDNKVVGGKYWAENSVDLELSFEKDIAKTLGLALGDVIEFAAAGENLTAKITSIRTVQWETMGVNFFVEGTRTLLEPFPATFITSFHLPENNDHVMAELVRNFPSVTALDVSALIEQVRKIMNRASTAIEFVALFTLLAGGLVLVSAIHTTQQERNLSTALIKTFGGSRFRTMSLHAAEFLIIGIISGVAGATAAQMCTWLIAREVLNIDYAFNWLLIVNGGILAAIAVLSVGLIAIFLSFKKPTRILLNPP